MSFIAIFCILLTFFSTSLCAKETNDKNFAWYLKNSLAYENSVMVNSSLLEIQTIIEHPIFTADLGISMNNFSQDISTKLRITPYQSHHLNVGFTTFFHAGFFTDIGQEIDVGTFAFIDIANKQKKNAFKFSFEIGYFYKFTFINLLPKHLKDLDLIFSIVFAQRFLDNHEIVFSLASYENYYYPLSFNPSFHLQYIYTINDRYILGAEAFIRYTDMFTLTGTIDGFQVKLFYILKLPL